ncbi:dipeptidase [Haliea sp. E17]|uniref:dipeptidase n=1 Tax=Haliea sp. E17 TaxID=3401576 RepID=UPI003AAE1D4B
MKARYYSPGRLAAPLLALVLANAVSAQAGDAVASLHERLLTVDTHIDIDVNHFTEQSNYTQSLTTQVDLPKMEAGGLDVVWLIVYTAQGELSEEGYAAALDNAQAKFAAIERLTQELAPERIGLATSAAEAREISASGRKVAMIGVENAYPLGTDVSMVREFYARGARYMSLSHNGHSQFADSNTGEADGQWLHGGLSPLGRELIVEMNRLGMMIDISHPSKQANLQAIALSKAPVIASHSSARALNDVSRNLSDEELLAVKENGGVVQATAFRSYLNTAKNAAWEAKAREVLARLAAEEDLELREWSALKDLTPEQRTDYLDRYRALRAKAQPVIHEEVDPVAPPVDVADFVDHIDYLVKMLGEDHVGISSDFDGGGGVSGWNDASETAAVTRELLERGYSESAIAKLWGGNLLRVMDEVQAEARREQVATAVDR